VSTIVTGMVWLLQMSPSAKSVLVSMADNANDLGACFPSISYMCRRTCLGRTAVMDAVKWLEDHEYLTADRSNGRHTTYQLNMDRIGELYRQAKEAEQARKRSASATGPAGGPVRKADATGPAAGLDRSARRTLTVNNHQEPKAPPPAAPTESGLPEWIDAKAWEGYCEMRRRIRFPLTAYAASLLHVELARLRGEGHDVAAVLNQSTRNGWRELFPVAAPPAAESPPAASGAPKAAASRAAGVSPAVTDTAASRLSDVQAWAVRMRDLGESEEFIAAEVARVNAKYAAPTQPETEEVSRGT
jgi:hypothetical protein